MTQDGEFSPLISLLPNHSDRKLVLVNHRLRTLSLAGFVALLALSGCGDYRTQRRIAVRTKNILMTWRTQMAAAKDHWETSLPLSSDAFLSRLQDDEAYRTYIGSTPFEDVDLKSKRILDGWRRPVILIAYEGKLGALGSAGANGIWEHGGGDDIVIPMEESSKHTGRE
ncbi:MAG: hypothetical protein R6V58_16495 [Planctomycetota bacterium]